MGTRNTRSNVQQQVADAAEDPRGAEVEPGRVSPDALGERGDEDDEQAESAQRLAGDEEGDEGVRLRGLDVVACPGTRVRFSFPHMDGNFQSAGRMED